MRRPLLASWLALVTLVLAPLVALTLVAGSAIETRETVAQTISTAAVGTAAGSCGDYGRCDPGLNCIHHICVDMVSLLPESSASVAEASPVESTSPYSQHIN